MVRRDLGPEPALPPPPLPETGWSVAGRPSCREAKSASIEARILLDESRRLHRCMAAEAIQGWWRRYLVRADAAAAPAEAQEEAKPAEEMAEAKVEEAKPEESKAETKPETRADEVSQAEEKAEAKAVQKAEAMAVRWCI